MAEITPQVEQSSSLNSRFVWLPQSKPPGSHVPRPGIVPRTSVRANVLIRHDPPVIRP